MAVQQVIRLRYNDLNALEKELLKLFPAGDFEVDFEMGQTILTVPRALTADEIQHINDKQRHYQRRSDRRG